MADSQSQTTIKKLPPIREDIGGMKSRIQDVTLIKDY